MASNQSIDSVLLHRIMGNREGFILATLCKKLNYSSRFSHNLKQALIIKDLIDLKKSTKVKVILKSEVEIKDVKTCISISNKQLYTVSLENLRGVYDQVPKEKWFTRKEVTKDTYKLHMALDCLYNLGKVRRRGTSTSKYSYFVPTPGGEISWGETKAHKLLKILDRLHNRGTDGIKDSLSTYLIDTKSPYPTKVRPILLNRGYVLETGTNSKTLRWNEGKGKPTLSLCEDIINRVKHSSREGYKASISGSTSDTSKPYTYSKLSVDKFLESKGLAEEFREFLEDEINK